MLQPGGTSFLEGFFQAKQPFVVHVVIEVHIHPCGRVVEQKPAGLGDGETLAFGVNKDSAYRQRCLKENFHGVVAQAGSLAQLAACETIIAITEQVKDAKFHHQSRHLKHHWRERYKFSQSLSVAS